MTDLNVTFSAEELEQILFGDAGVEVLMQKMFSEVLQAEMTEHLGPIGTSEARTGPATDTAAMSGSSPPV